MQRLSSLPLKVVGVLYSGSQYECPVCKKGYNKMLPYGRIVSRPNALCPNCLSLERHRLIWLYLSEQTDFFTAPLKMLHVAPEACFIDRFEALPNLDYITADIESPLAKVKMDVHDIPFDENTFDVVFCNHVLEHVTNDIQVLKEFHRVLKPGGWAILQSPIDLALDTTYEDASITTPEEREKHFGQDDHLRMFGKDYGERLKQGGFEVTPHAVTDLNPGLSRKYALDQTEVLYVCSKPAAASS